MNIEHKKTALEDDSLLYQKRDDSLGKKDTSALSGRQKIGYFKDYYLKAVIVALIAAAVAAALIYNMFFRYQNTVLSAAVVGDAWITDTDGLVQALRDYYGLTNENDYIIVEHYNPEDYASQIKLSTYVAAREIDLLLCSEDIFNQYAEMGFLYDLSQELPDEIYQRFAAQAVKASQVDTDDDGNILKTYPAAPYGFDITQNAVFQKYGGTGTSDQKVILAVIGNAQEHMDSIVKFLDFLLQE